MAFFKDSKDRDGTIVIFGFFICLILFMVFTFRNFDFAVLETSKRMIELFSAAFMFIIGFLFGKKTGDNNGNNDKGVG